MSDHGADHGHAAVVPTHASTGLTREQLLVMYGFVKPEHLSEYKQKIGYHTSIAKRRKAVRQLGLAKAKEMAFQELTEVVDEGFDYSGFPAASTRFHLVLESSAENVEDSYFDILEKTRQTSGFPLIYKVSDYYAASENSAFFGNSQQRLGIQQDRVQQFLANIGKFVKELFQMVRELRILDERLAIYEATGGLPEVKKGLHHDDHAGHEHAHAPAAHKGHGGHGAHGHGHATVDQSPAADITLKSIFTDLVEGGTKNPQSVFGLASQVNFTLLPDLFFNTYVKDKDKVDEVVEKMQYNKSLKAVLKRKLYQYLVWKEKTYFELKHRRSFNLKYLRQHWTIIKMYMAWVKPYLRNIERLTMKQSFFDEADVIAAFETSFIEVEFVAAKQPVNGYHPVVLATFFFRSRPDMSARKEYQTGPVHMGRMDMSLRAYAWTPAELQAYRDLKKREEIELLGVLDSSLTEIMEALGEDFEEYLKEAGEDVEEKDHAIPPKKKEDGALAPFVSLFGGFKDMVEAFIPRGGDDHHHSHGDPKKAHDIAGFHAGLIYHTYKKGRRMITW
jgi:hypothetical protein